MQIRKQWRDYGCNNASKIPEEYKQCDIYHFPSHCSWLYFLYTICLYDNSSMP